MSKTSAGAATWFTPPSTPAGTPACTCCGAATGPRSWELPICLSCYEASQGKRTSPIVYVVQKVSGGRFWKTVKFSREHKNCPLAGVKQAARGVLRRP